MPGQGFPDLNILVPLLRLVRSVFVGMRHDPVNGPDPRNRRSSSQIWELAGQLLPTYSSDDIIYLQRLRELDFTMMDATMLRILEAGPSLDPAEAARYSLNRSEVVNDYRVALKEFVGEFRYFRGLVAHCTRVANALDQAFDAYMIRERPIREAREAERRGAVRQNPRAGRRGAIAPALTDLDHGLFDGFSWAGSDNNAEAAATMGAPALVDREDSPPNGVQMALDMGACLLYTSPSPRDGLLSRMPSSA